MRKTRLILSAPESAVSPRQSVLWPSFFGIEYPLSQHPNLGISSAPSYVLPKICVFACGVDFSAGDILGPSNSNICRKVGFSASALSNNSFIAATLIAMITLSARATSFISGGRHRVTPHQKVRELLSVDSGEWLGWFGKWVPERVVSNSDLCGCVTPPLHAQHL